MIVFTATLIGSTSVAWAVKDERMNRQLLKLDPKTRLEQTCDVEVMERINQDTNPYNPDRIEAYAFEMPVIGEDERSFIAHGAAFRSQGNWYRLSFRCVTGPRHLDAHSLEYAIGAKIPQSEWQRYGLYH
jgi:hypothetical protein